MTTYAQIENSVVKNVILADEEFINSGLVGDPKQWLETSETIRANLARVGFVYDSEHDIFYDPKPPYPSWLLNQVTWRWEAPVSPPEDFTGSNYLWMEPTKTWVPFVLHSAPPPI